MAGPVEDQPTYLASKAVVRLQAKVTVVSVEVREFLRVLRRPAMHYKFARSECWHTRRARRRPQSLEARLDFGIFFSGCNLRGRENDQGNAWPPPKRASCLGSAPPTIGGHFEHEETQCNGTEAGIVSS
jgi:hypothetical protein